MNERIKELVLQAGFEPHYEPDGTFSYGQQFEKFAELIVRECAHKQLSLALNYEVRHTYDVEITEFVEGTVNGLREGAESIMHHFGVQ